MTYFSYKTIQCAQLLEVKMANTNNVFASNLHNGLANDQLSSPHTNVNPWSNQHGGQFNPPFQPSVMQPSNSYQYPGSYNEFGSNKGGMESCQNWLYQSSCNMNRPTTHGGPSQFHYNQVPFSLFKQKSPNNKNSQNTVQSFNCNQNQPIYTQELPARNFEKTPPVNYNQPSPSTQAQVPTPGYNWGQTTYNQAPQSHNFEKTPTLNYNPTLISDQAHVPVPGYNWERPTYNQVPPPNFSNDNVTNETANLPLLNKQNLGFNHPQLGMTCQQPYQSEGGYRQLNMTTQTVNEDHVPQKVPKRPHMPSKLQTTFKMAKKSSSHLHHPLTSTQTLQSSKSAISTVHDMAHENGWTLNWCEESEVGPPHAKVFTIRVTMGPYQLSGSGRSKKLAKQEAAQLLAAHVAGNEVGDIIGLPGFTGDTGQCMQPKNTSEAYGPQLPLSEQSKTSIPVQNSGDNPISMLDQLTKKHKLGDPNYTTVCENGPLVLQRFEIKVTVNSMEASGLGRSKKVAKRNAAQAMLDQLSRKKLVITPPKQQIKFVKASAVTESES